jgi:Zn-finger in ubiquitin-hydrolases and other protein
MCWGMARCEDGAREYIMRCPYSKARQRGVLQVTLCEHLWSVVDVTPSSVGCDECIRAGMHWVNLRICMTCGNVGCCNDSLGKHASAHWFLNPGHPIIRSFEAGEGWWWCFWDGLLQVKNAPPAPSHTNAGAPWRGYEAENGVRQTPPCWFLRWGPAMHGGVRTALPEATIWNRISDRR